MTHFVHKASKTSDTLYSARCS